MAGSFPGELNVGDWKPQFARSAFRNDKWPHISCSYISLPYIKAGVLAIPSCYADDFEIFCKFNEASCPLLYRSQPGEVSVPPLAADSDIRRDLQLYSIFINGEMIETVHDVSHIPWNDMVTFYMGCSFSFENVLLTAGIPLRHMQQKREIPVYCSGIEVHPVGPFKGRTIVTLRAMPRDHIQRAVEITAVMDRNHGAPVHIGDPRMIGIRDLHKEYLGKDPPYLENGDVPVFWACNITSGEAWRDVKCPMLSIAHSEETVGALFVADVSVKEFNRENPPAFGKLRPQVVFVSEDPVFASVLSDRALSQLKKLESCVMDEMHGKRSSFVNDTLIISHATQVAVDIELLPRQDKSVDHAHLMFVLAVTRGLAALGKRVILRTRTGCDVTWRKAVEKGVAIGMIPAAITVENKRCDMLNPCREKETQITNMVVIQNSSEIEDNTNRNTRSKINVILTLREDGIFTLGNITLSSQPSPVTIEEATSKALAESNFPFRIGEAISLALYVLHSCPIHSRYYRKGVGQFKPLDINEFIATDRQMNELIENLRESKELPEHAPEVSQRFMAAHAKVLEELVK